MSVQLRTARDVYPVQYERQHRDTATYNYTNRTCGCPGPRTGTAFRGSALPFFLAAEFHRFFTAFSDLPGNSLAILVQLKAVSSEHGRGNGTDFSVNSSHDEPFAFKVRVLKLVPELVTACSVSPEKIAGERFDLSINFRVSRLTCCRIGLGQPRELRPPPVSSWTFSGWGRGD